MDITETMGVKPMTDQEKRMALMELVEQFAEPGDSFGDHMNRAALAWAALTDPDALIFHRTPRLRLSHAA